MVSQGVGWESIAGEGLPVVLNWLPRSTAFDPYFTETLTSGSMPGIRVGTMPLAVKEALTLLASAAEMPAGEHALSSSGAAKAVEAVNSSEAMVEKCMLLDDRVLRDGER